MQRKVSSDLKLYLRCLFLVPSILNAFKGQSDRLRAGDTPCPCQDKLNKNQVHVRSEPKLQASINLNVSLQLRQFDSTLFLNDVYIS